MLASLQSISDDSVAPLPPPISRTKKDKHLQDVSIVTSIMFHHD